MNKHFSLQKTKKSIVMYIFMKKNHQVAQAAVEYFLEERKRTQRY